MKSIHVRATIEREAKQGSPPPVRHMHAAAHDITRANRLRREA